MDYIKNIIEISSQILMVYYFVLITHRSMQILQQENYYYQGYRIYLKNYYLYDTNNLYLLGGLLMVPFIKSTIIQIIFILYYLLVLQFIKTEAVKKLNFTRRIRRLYVMHVTLISAIYTLLMFVIDFHDLIILLFVIVLLTPIHLLFAYFINYPLELWISKMYKNKAKKKLDKLSADIIAITGSYGKTTTKNILYELLKDEYITTKSPYSYNTINGLSYTVNNLLLLDEEVVILEAGISHKNDMKKISELFIPQAVIITDIGNQHLETLKTIDNIVNEKFYLLDQMNSGIAVLNYDNYYIKSKSIKESIRVVSYALDNDADYRATDVEYSTEGVNFTIVGSDMKIEVFSQLIGKHNIYNILAAVALIKTMYPNTSNQRIKDVISGLEPLEHRMQIIHKDGLTIIDNSYSSNEKGFENSLEVLRSYNNRVLITPGIVSLGNESQDVNYLLAKKIMAVCDFVYLIKNTSANYIIEGFKVNGFKNYLVVGSFKEAYSHVVNKHQGATVLIENDLTDNYLYRR